MRTLSCLFLFSLVVVAASVLAGEPTSPPAGKILMVFTNTDKIPGTDRETGFWAEEFVVPYRIFTKAGY